MSRILHKISLITGSVFAAVLLLPNLAQACAVCFDPTGETRWTFIATTAFLTFLPLILIGTLIYYIRKRIEERDAES